MASETVFYNNKKLVGIGSVGIGTTTPGVTLDVTGTVRASTQFSGPGTGLTGTASSLSVGAATNATYATALSGTYTIGQILYGAGNGTPQATSTFVYSAGRVGIGSASPGVELDVVGNMRIAQGYTYIGGAGVNNAAFALNYIDTTASYKSLIFGRDNSAYNAGEINFNYVGAGSGSNWLGLGFYAYYPVAITAGGKMGIGITNPGAPLTIINSSTGNDPSTSQFYVYNPTNAANQSSIIACRCGGSSSGYTYYSLDVAGAYGFSMGMAANSSRLQFRDAWNFLGTERMTILSSGNVGIGSTNPQSKLVASSSGGVSTQIVSETTGLNSFTGGPTVLLRALGSPYTNSYTQLFAEYNAAGIPKTWFSNWDGGSTYGQLNIQTAINQIWFNNYTTAGTLLITSAGQVYSSSDARIKSNISPLSGNFTSNIMDLRPVYYTLNSDPGRMSIGFIAQDIEKIIPEAVDGKKYEYTWKTKKINEIGGATIPDLDENGNLQFTDEIRPRGLDDRAIIACLVKAFQEQVTKSEDLETKLQTAQNDIDLLESRLAAIEALISTNTSADATTTSTGTRSDALLAEAGAV